MPDKNAVFATSNPIQISFVLDAILNLQPTSILDIGCGSGKYGVLLREYFPAARIDGVEGFAPYITQVHRVIYNNVYEANVIDAIRTITDNYDLAIMIDMFEHLAPIDGMNLLAALKKISASILISVPVWHPVQEAIHGNTLQEHRAQYDAAALRNLGFTQIVRLSGNYVALHSAKRINLRRQAMKCGVTALLPEWLNRAFAPISRRLH
jgi:trans-aconitate methyltransferase